MSLYAIAYVRHGEQYWDLYNTPVGRTFNDYETARFILDNDRIARHNLTAEIISLPSDNITISKTFRYDEVRATDVITAAPPTPSFTYIGAPVDENIINNPRVPIQQVTNPQIGAQGNLGPLLIAALALVVLK